MEEVGDAPFAVIAVAMDSDPEAARPWIEAAGPGYPCLIDRDHYVADLYHMVNVPQAVWIDEGGRIVRPSENAGAYEGFRARDRSTGRMPPEVAEKTANAKRTYVEAVKDWALRGAASAHVFSADAARAHVAAPTAASVRAHAAFRLGQHLLRGGKPEEAARFLAEASRLHPDSWNIWRQQAGKNELGLAALPDFWARVEKLATGAYYPAVDMKNMPE